MLAHHVCHPGDRLVVDEGSSPLHGFLWTAVTLPTALVSAPVSLHCMESVAIGRHRHPQLKECFWCQHLPLPSLKNDPILFASNHRVAGQFLPSILA
jgi:hypothetical protein